MRLVLGSGSPRRKELLTKMGYRFQVVTADVTESDDASLGLEGLSILNAKLKAEAVYKELDSPEGVVIGSDTVVWLNGKAYGKPKTTEEAHQMLSELSGKTHQVGTGVALATPKSTITFCEIADVTFHELSLEDIESYVKDVPVMDKAGAYAIQHGGDRIIDHYVGEFECIMGLPVKKLESKLNELGIQSA